MSKTMKPRDKAASTKPTSEKKPGAELDEKALEKVSGGKGCASGQHIKDGILTT
jgi:hypothetical protein